MELSQKTCCACCVSKSFAEFGKLQSSKDGLAYSCKECMRTKARIYASDPKNLEKIRKTKSNWKKRNRASVNVQQNKRRNERMRTDFVYKISVIARNRLTESINSKGLLKTKKTTKYTGCSSYELVQHLEKQFKEGMTWENHGQFGWHVDHIKPIASFDLSDPEQQKKAFHFTNLRPLWWHENLARNKEKFQRDVNA